MISSPQFFFGGVHVAHLLVFCGVVVSVAFSTLIGCSVRIYLQLFVGGIMSRYLCLLAHSGVQHILCCIFALLFFVLLLVSLGFPFLISPSVFSNV